MDYKEMQKNLRRIAETKADMLTAEDKAYVRKAAAELGVQFSAGKSRCKACYIDAAILCFSAAKTKEAEENAASDTRRFILKPGVDVYFGNIRVNEATLTDDLAERILERGFAADYFVKCE